MGLDQLEELIMQCSKEGRLFRELNGNDFRYGFKLGKIIIYYCNKGLFLESTKWEIDDFYAAPLIHHHITNKAIVKLFADQFNIRDEQRREEVKFKVNALINEITYELGLTGEGLEDEYREQILTGEYHTLVDYLKIMGRPDFADKIVNINNEYRGFGGRR